MKEHNREDLRTFLSEVDETVGVLKIAKEIDICTELPALCSEARQPVLFENPKNYSNFRVVDCLLHNRRLQSLAFKCNEQDVIQSYARILGQGPGQTMLIDNSPVKDIILKGDDANLGLLPAVTPSEGIDLPHMDLKPSDFHIPVISGSIMITRDPATNVHNCSFTMAEVKGNRRAHCYIFSPHANRNINAYAELGEKAPIALVIGCHPAYELASVYTGPHPGFCEYELAANIFKAPIALIKCETVDLQVPAYAEIVIEGYITPERSPYLHTSAHTDTHGPIYSNEPTMEVTAITMRKDPIYRHIQPTRFTDHHAICEFIIAPFLFSILQSKGIQVHDVNVPLRSCVNCAVIQMTAICREEVKDALLTSMGLPFMPRLTIAVDNDVDIYDMNDVLYAMSVRVDPARDVTILDGTRSFDLEPSARIIPGLENSLLRSSGRYGIDATKPPLCEPEERSRFTRLRARGESKVLLKDYID